MHVTDELSQEVAEEESGKEARKCRCQKSSAARMLIDY